MTTLSTANDTAGTCGRGYLLDPAPHAWQPADVDPGQRPRCTCGSENRSKHLRTPAAVPSPRPIPREEQKA